MSENGRGTEQTKSANRKRARADRGRLKRAEARGAIAMLLERAHRWRSLRVHQIAADLADVLLGSPRVRGVMVRSQAGGGRSVDVVRGRDELEGGLRAELERSPGGAEGGDGATTDGAPVRVVRLPSPDDIAVVVAGTGDEFPGEAEGLFLRVACEQAALAIHAAQLRERIDDAEVRRDEFLSAFGHELRDRLAPVMNALGLMKMSQSGGGERERHIIERQVTHLAYLVNDLLDLANLARGRLRIKRELVDVMGAVNGALDLCGPILGDRRDRVRITEVPAGISIEADRRRLEQVFAILLTRAVRASGPDGPIELSVVRAGRDVEIHVRDGGTATSPIPLPDLFDPFAAPPEGAELHQGVFGMSLGLALARGLVELQGGQVTATADAAGTELTVQFTIMADRAAPPRKVVPPRGQFDLAAGLRVLVVDDNVDAGDALGMMLEASGLNVKVTYGAMQALQVAETRRFDVAILDIGLPGMDGFELAERLQRTRHGGEMKMFALSGFGEEATVARAKQVGFRRHFVKPIDTAVLVAAIVQDAGRGPRGNA